MFDIKKALKAGMEKKTIYIFPYKDIKGKEHFIAVDSLDHAKQYGNGEMKQVTMYFKNNF